MKQIQTATFSFSKAQLEVFKNNKKSQIADLRGIPLRTLQPLMIQEGLNEMVALSVDAGFFPRILTAYGY